MIEKKDDFIREILSISQSVVEKEKVDYNVEKFKESFFRQSSHSPENLESMNYIEYGAVRIKYLGNRRVFGLKVKDKDILLSDIIYFLESDEICRIIKNEFPELTVKEIEAVQRVFTIIMSGLECLELDD
ncbi:hypothetical protein [Acetivibrio clariflavus]|uniref:Uncharacterized protein n=1 Tax=Acetivibrio clariflavus (strain DSM 19732 / NBRC 101661 / EBR45) TaxID=720554 RepID=G8M252_ACECE|nr:hypothetical protein [Acetivibrio clariflavus]AEV68170.1 hypothetical protein Clocl_1526 [Acetivibrio clariflavus DSM 19732]